MEAVSYTRNKKGTTTFLFIYARVKKGAKF
jgi:hypothetical protein